MNKIITLTAIGVTDDTYYNRSLCSCDPLNFLRVPTFFKKFDAPVEVNLGNNAIEKITAKEYPVYEFEIRKEQKDGFLNRLFRMKRRYLNYDTIETVKCTVVQMVSKRVYFVRESVDEISKKMSSN